MELLDGFVELLEEFVELLDGLVEIFVGLPMVVVAPPLAYDCKPHIPALKTELLAHPVINVDGATFFVKIAARVAPTIHDLPN